MDKEVQEKITPEQVIYNLSIYLQTNGQTVPPAFKSSLKYCLGLIARSKLPKGKPPLLSDTKREQIISELPDRGYGIAIFREGTPIEYQSREEILAYNIAKAQLDICIKHHKGDKQC